MHFFNVFVQFMVTYFGENNVIFSRDFVHLEFCILPYPETLPFFSVNVACSISLPVCNRYLITRGSAVKNCHSCFCLSLYWYIFTPGPQGRQRKWGINLHTQSLVIKLLLLLTIVMICRGRTRVFYPFTLAFYIYLLYIV